MITEQITSIPVAVSRSKDTVVEDHRDDALRPGELKRSLAKQDHEVSGIRVVMLERVRKHITVTLRDLLPPHIWRVHYHYVPPAFVPYIRSGKAWHEYGVHPV